MKVKINSQEIELHYSNRIYIIYEQMMDKSIDPSDFNKITNILTLLYATILGTLQYKRLPASLDWNDYMDWVDTQANIIEEFSEWFVKETQAQKSPEPIKENKDKLPRKKKLS